jgi:pyruvate dehydrogenase E2 component (dihydrolipoamide acetyltransferase)
MEPFREVRSPERNYGPARLSGGVTVTPLARRLAGEAGLDLSKITGSGPHGRIVAADIAQARSAKAPALASAAAANIVLTADVELTQALALIADVSGIELTDIVVKAWGLALTRASLDASGIALTAGANRAIVANAASLSLTAIAAARDAANDTNNATTAISIPGVPGITSVADVLRPPQTTLLSLGAPRRAPVEAADGSVKFVSAMTATLSCDAGALDAAAGAALLAAFKGFVEKPVTMIV